MRFYYPEFKTKAVTFSYDDCREQDIRLTELFNRYGMKATFNVNTGHFGDEDTIVRSGYTVPFKVIDISRFAEVYHGHELASHTLNHPLLTSLSDEDFEREVCEDVANIEKITGTHPIGFAYPGGKHNKTVAEKLKSLGIKYARTVGDTKNFTHPDDFLIWNPTSCDIADDIISTAAKFISIDESDENLPLFYIWGHSFDLDIPDRDHWAELELICAALSRDNNTWYAANGNIYNYLTAVREIKCTDPTVNNTGIDLYIEEDGKRFVWRTGKEKIR
ncbi:MAG: polysaccharide deacetylase [Ruminococcaceae bacterium]|nr:polysaccharide deacetylase [Oscillospiraceae bacterium]